MIRLATVCLVTLLSTGAVQAGGDRIFSGPQPGEKLTPFKVLAFSGPSAGKETMLASKDQQGAVLFIFVHEITRPAFAMIKPVDLYASKLAKEGLSTHFVWLTDDKTKTEAWLNNAKGSLKLKNPVTISLDGQEGPGNYGLNRKVTLTILVGKNGKTTANFAIIQPNETDAPKVLAAIAKVMNKKAPTLAALQKELGKGRPAAKGKIPAELTSLMRQLIQKTNDEATVKKVIGDIEKWVGNNKRKQALVRQIGGRILQAGYGTPAAQKALKKLVDTKQPC